MSTSSDRAQTATNITEMLAAEAQHLARQAGTDDGLSFEAGIAARHLIEGYLHATEASERMQSPSHVAFALQGADPRLIEHAGAWVCKHAFKLFVAGRVNRLTQEAGRSREFSTLYARTLTTDPKARARVLTALEQAVDPYRRKAEQACCKELRAVYSVNLKEDA